MPPYRRLTPGERWARQRRVYRLRHPLDGSPPMTFREIGRLMGFSLERARQVYYTALRRAAHREAHAARHCRCFVVRGLG